MPLIAVSANFSIVYMHSYINLYIYIYTYLYTNMRKQSCLLKKRLKKAWGGSIVDARCLHLRLRFCGVQKGRRLPVGRRLKEGWQHREGNRALKAGGPDLFVRRFVQSCSSGEPGSELQPRAKGSQICLDMHILSGFSRLTSDDCPILDRHQDSPSKELLMSLGLSLCQVTDKPPCW